MINQPFLEHFFADSTQQLFSLHNTTTSYNVCAFQGRDSASDNEGSSSRRGERSRDVTPVYDLTTGEPETARQSGELLWDRERERLKKREREAAASAVQQHSLAMVAREQTAAGLFTRSAFHLPSSYHSRLTTRNLDREASGSWPSQCSDHCEKVYLLHSCEKLLSRPSSSWSLVARDTQLKAYVSCSQECLRTSQHERWYLVFFFCSGSNV